MPGPGTRLILIRHGHVDTGPPPGRLCGWLDLPLSATGEASVRAMRQRGVRREAPAALYTSSLRRARAVAEVLGEMWGLVPNGRDTLREIHCGAFEGVALEEIANRHPDLWARNRAQDDEAFAWPGGESYRAFRARVLEALGHVARAHHGERVAIVTHTGVVTQLLGAMRGRSPAIWDADRPNPLTATEVSWVNGAPDALITFDRRDWY